MTDTDSKMMRRQQNLDTPQTIEGEGPEGPADLDAADGEDRRRAAAGLGEASAADSQEAVFAQNTRDAPASGGSGGQGRAAGGPRKPGGLVRKGRSLLGA